MIFISQQGSSLSQVLALKYRPSSFEKLIGQESITQTLTQALDQNRLSHAYLFSGLRGSGKTSTARIFAKCLVCDNGPTSTPCESCENCKMANEGRHIDIIEMDAASSRKIDDIRSLIEQTKYKPNSAKFKIFIIDEVHMLTKEAFNALLKTLEEPPEFVKFILATTDPMKLPPTILSRTQHFRFKKINQNTVIKHLSHILNLENIEYEKEALGILTRAGNGSLRDTLTLLDQAIIYSKNYVDAKSVASMLGVLDPQILGNIYNYILNNDHQKIIETIKELENYEGEVVIDELISYLKERFFEQDPRFSTMLYDRFFKILSESKKLLFINADSTFVLTLLFFKMMEATKIKEIDKMIEKLESKIISSDKKIQPTSTQSPAKPSTVQESTNQITSKPLQSPSDSNEKKRFQTLITKLYDRNYELGECFEKSISFISYENDTLTLMSCANEECKKLLRLSSGIIKHFVKDTFTLETKIVMKPCNKTSSQNEEPKDDKKEEPIENPDPVDSCISNQTIGESKNSEIDPDNILENPFVKTAGELFEPSRIIVKSKV